MQARIASPDFWERIDATFGQSGGIYKLSCLRDGSTEELVPVQRLLGEDPEGVLYIGMAACFLERVIELKKSLSPRHVSRGHECGARHKEHDRLAQAFPYERLMVSFIASESPRDAEQHALQDYFNSFGELPPLNRAG